MSILLLVLLVVTLSGGGSRVVPMSGLVVVLVGTLHEREKTVGRTGNRGKITTKRNLK